MGNISQLTCKSIGMVCAVMIVFLCSHSGVLARAHSVYTGQNHRLLLISFDGFRHDYVAMAKKAGKNVTNFLKAMENGATVTTVHNQFPTKTHTNHFSIVTGHYPESHGVIGNRLYDPYTNRSYKGLLSKDQYDDSYYNNGTDQNSAAEPVWVTNQKASTDGFPRRSGAMKWLGTDYEISNRRPFYFKYTESKLISNLTQVDTLVGWYTDKEAPINLGLWYISFPDHIGHKYGPESPQELEAIEDADRLLGYLLDQMKSHGILDTMNIIITSDHGMTTLNPVMIELDNYVNRSWYDAYGYSPVWNISPKPEKLEAVYDALRQIPNMSVYYKNNTPRQYHYRYNRRIQSIVIEAHAPYKIVYSVEAHKNKSRVLVGDHGYNSSFADMRPFFIAQGPSFKRNFTLHSPISNIDIYPFMCYLLSLQPAPNNGTMVPIQDILLVAPSGAGSVFSWTALIFVCTVALSASIAGIFCITACRVQGRSNRRLVPISLDSLSEIQTSSEMRNFSGEQTGLLSGSEDELP